MHATKQLTIVAALAGLLLGPLAGCGAPPSRHSGSGGGSGGGGSRGGGVTKPAVVTYMAEYTDRIKRNLATLESADAETADDLLLSAEVRESMRDGIRNFLKTLGGYQRLLGRLKETWNATGATDIREALALSGQVHEQLQKQALQLSLQSRVVESEFNEQTSFTTPEAPGVDVEPTRKYLQVYQKTTAIAASIDTYLRTLHQKSLIPYSEVAQPAEGVFHFLRLHELPDPNVDAHARYFETAWKAWVYSERDAGRFGEAMAVFALVMELGDRFRPDSLQSLREIALASLDKVPELRVVEQMEAAVDTVKKAARALGRTPPNWEAEFQRIAAALQLLRAHGMEDPATRLSLALQARKLDPFLTQRVEAFIISTGEQIGDLYIESSQYEGAIAAFDRTLALASVPNRLSLVRDYHSSVFQRGLDEAEKAAEQRRFPEAKQILGQLKKMAMDKSEEASVGRMLFSYYERYMSHAFEQDSELALEVSAEMVQAIPSAEAKRKADGLLYRLLKKNIGELETSHERLGPDEVLRQFRETVARMSTEEGTALCQSFLGAIEEVWGRQMERSTRAADVYALGFGMARLDGSNPSLARRRAAEALAYYFSRVAAEDNWDEVEACINTRLKECPSEARSPDYRQTYLRFLEWLDRGADVERLGRHLAIFSLTYPDDLDEVRQLISGRMSHSSVRGLSFYALLKTVDPDCDEVQEFEAAGPPPDSVRTALLRLISSREVAAARIQSRQSRVTKRSPEPPTRGTSRRLPTEFAGDGADGSDGDRSATASGGSRGAVFSAVACSIFIVIVVLLTRSGGILSFGWYAGAALWLGVTIGLLLGSAASDDELATPHHQAPAAHVQVVSTTLDIPPLGSLTPDEMKARSW